VAASGGRIEAMSAKYGRFDTIRQRANHSTTAKNIPYAKLATIKILPQKIFVRGTHGKNPK